MTYSVVARDPSSGVTAVACQSHLFGVGQVVNHAEAGVGAIANQAFVEPAHAERGLALLRAGASAQVALSTTLARDAAPELRQVAVLDASGGLAVHTGERCVPTAGSRAGTSWLVQGNMLAAEAVLDDMAAAMDAERDLVDRVLAALAAADAAGGDLRGRQSAGILVVAGEVGGGVKLDLRVEDAPDPVAELTRLVSVARATATVLGVVLAEGFVLGELPGPDEVDTALTALDAIAAGGSEAAIEAAIWRTVVLHRTGRTADAAASATALAARRPSTARFLTNLASAGFMDGSPI